MFTVERLVLRQINEAVTSPQEGVASADDIDLAMVLATGFPCDEKGVGAPLHWADARGLDTVLEELEELRRLLGPRFWPHHLLKSYVHAGFLGRKTEGGFFAYWWQDFGQYWV